MAVIADTVEESVITQDRVNGFIITRGFLVTEIPSIDRSDPFMILNALTTPGIPALNEHHPASRRHIVVNRVARPTGPNSVRVSCTYQFPIIGPIPSNSDWVLIDEQDAGTEETQLDVNLEPIQVVFNSGEADISNPNSEIIGGTIKTVTANIYRPLRAFRASGIINQPPSPQMLDFAGQTVNDQEWIGKPKGFWFCSNVREVIEKNANGRYAIEASFKSRVYRDWSEYAIYKNNITGNVEPLILTAANRQLIRQVMTSEYQYNFQDRRANGFVKWGPYPTANFRQVFGFFKDPRYDSGSFNQSNDNLNLNNSQ
jgi:hypothetical protein